MPSLRKKTSDLKKRMRYALKGGGTKAIEKQKATGKMTARERIVALLDPKSFHEYDLFVEHAGKDFDMDKKYLPGDGVITGTGTISGYPACIFAQDFTVAGGSLGWMHAKKITKIMDHALKLKVPLIGINDSGGARIQEGVNSLAGYGEIFYRNTMASGLIPQISVILGPCAGGAVYSPALTDFIFMSKENSYMFVTGPKVTKTVTGEEITTEDLGGPDVHGKKSGVAHFIAEDEEEGILLIRKLLSFLPQNNLEDPPITECNDPINRKEDLLNDIIPSNPNQPYNVSDVIYSIVDNSEFLQVQRHYAKNIITGFAKFNGMPVGIVANQPDFLAGVLDINASRKAARFVRFCDAFNLPVVTLVDVPGFLPGSAQEYAGIIIHGAKLLFAYGEATVPKVT
ncbi:MAG: acyl-CoA carboxylase subunit beta, partial [Bacteroidales bacterium]|nr:acyl-CoA carboxylase subunit beta [Bacteroidales bacterium]